MAFSSTLNFILRHPINRGRPIAAITRFAKWQLVSRLRREVEFTWISGSKLVVSRGMTGATGNIYCGLHEYADMAFVLHVLRAGDLFLDVGANVGSYTVLAAAVCGANAISIEPDPTTARYLARNISANNIGSLCTIAQTAVGCDEGSITFTVGKDTVNKIATNADNATQIVPLMRLDSLLHGRAPSLMKMDVEGYELEALAGAVELLIRPELKAIIIENTDTDVVSILTRHGFERYFYNPVLRQLSTIESEHISQNGLFIRDVTWTTDRLKRAAYHRIIGKLI